MSFFLNPELRAGRTPPLGDDGPKSATFAVKVPLGKTQAILTNLPKPDYGTLKPLPAPATTRAEDFNGTWKGSGTIYNGAYDFELNLIAHGRTCRGAISLNQTRRQIKDIAQPASSKKTAGPAASVTSGGKRAKTAETA